MKRTFPRSGLGIAAALTLAAVVAACSESQDDVLPPTEGGPAPAADTPGTTKPVPLPVVHLTNTQYTNTVRDLFAPLQVAIGELPAEPASEFDSRAKAQPVSAQYIEAYQDSASKVAESLLPQVGALVGCTPKSDAEEQSCLRTFVERFGKKAYRRPLTGAEKDALVAFFGETRKNADFPRSVVTLVEAMLQSPSFLYRIERGPEGSPQTGIVELSPYEVASRLSFFLWNTMPDEALFQAADSGEIVKSAAIEAHTRRMLADPRGRAMVARFHAVWLRFDRLKDGLAKDPSYGFDAETTKALRDGAAAYVDNLFYNDGKLGSFLLDTHAYVNQKTAPLYGITSKSAQLELLPVDPSQRSGILTTVGFLASFAHEKESAPVLRGVFVLDRLLCRPAPPPNVANVTPPPLDPQKPTTTRDRMEKQHSVGGCQGCHQAIDGVGFGFENYDAVGKWRTTDNGFPVNATGQVGGVPFNGAVDLAKKLAADKSVHACVASQWMRYSMGFEAADIPSSNLDPIAGEFEKSGLDMRALVGTLTNSDMFRKRALE